MSLDLESLTFTGLDVDGLAIGLGKDLTALGNSVGVTVNKDATGDDLAVDIDLE